MCFFPLCFLNMLVSKGSRSGSQNKRRSSPAQLTSSPRRRLLSSFMTSKRQADEEVGLPKQSSATKRIPQALLEYLILIFFMFYIANICVFFFFLFPVPLRKRLRGFNSAVVCARTQQCEDFTLKACTRCSCLILHKSQNSH